MTENNPTNNVTQAMTELIENIANWVKQTLEQLVPALQTIYEQYQQAGAPYGDTHEGCLRWMRELAEVRQLEARAEYLIAHHQGLAYLRKQLAEKRADVPRESGE